MDVLCQVLTLRTKYATGWDAGDWRNGSLHASPLKALSLHAPAVHRLSSCSFKPSTCTRDLQVSDITKVGPLHRMPGLQIPLQTRPQTYLPQRFRLRQHLQSPTMTRSTTFSSVDDGMLSWLQCRYAALRHAFSTPLCPGAALGSFEGAQYASSMSCLLRLESGCRSRMDAGIRKRAQGSAM